LTSSSPASVCWAFYIDIIVDGQAHSWASCIDIVVDGQAHSWTLISVNIVVDGQHPCWTFGVTLLGFLSPASSPAASISWASFVNLTVDGQLPLDLSSLSSRSILCCRRRDR
jgi:hypothetical protein